MGKRIGYARVSTDEQNTDMQIDALNKDGCETIYIDDGVSGSVRERPELVKMMASVERGDTIVVYKLDRLGRSMSHLVEMMDDMGKRGIQFKSIQESIDTTSVYGQALFGMLAVFAQLERDVIKERITSGVRARMARGGKQGRVCKYSQDQLNKMVEMKTVGFTYQDIANHYDCTWQNIRYHIKRYVI